MEKLVEGETDATNFGFEATLWEDQTQITFPENVGADIRLSADKQTATFTLNKNGTVTFTNLPVGVQLVVVETKAQGADSTTNNFDADADVHYTVLAGNNDKIVFTNIYEEKYGELIITKQLDSEDYHDPHQSFIFTVTNDENGFEMTVVINADDVINGTSGKQVTIKNLPLGKYTVKEDTGWSSRYDEVTIAEMDGGEGSDTDGVVEVKADTTPEVTFTNTRTKKTWIDGFTQCTNLFTGDDNRTKYED